MNNKHHQKIRDNLYGFKSLCIFKNLLGTYLSSKKQPARGTRVSHYSLEDFYRLQMRQTDLYTTGQVS